MFNFYTTILNFNNKLINHKILRNNPQDILFFGKMGTNRSKPNKINKMYIQPDPKSD